MWCDFPESICPETAVKGSCNVCGDVKLLSRLKLELRDPHSKNYCDALINATSQQVQLLPPTATCPNITVDVLQVDESCSQLEFEVVPSKHLQSWHLINLIMPGTNGDIVTSEAKIIHVAKRKMHIVHVVVYYYTCTCMYT